MWTPSCTVVVRGPPSPRLPGTDPRLEFRLEDGPRQPVDRARIHPEISVVAHRAEKCAAIADACIKDSMIRPSKAVWIQDATGRVPSLVSFIRIGNAGSDPT